MKTIRITYNTIYLLIITIFLQFVFSSCSNKVSEEAKAIKIDAVNPSNIQRKDAIITISLVKLKHKYPAFNQNYFYVTDSGKEIPSQLEDINTDGIYDNLLFLTSFNPNEEKHFQIHYNTKGVKKRNYRKRTQAVLGVKKNYKKVKGLYTGGDFVDVDSVIVPKDHFPHDALFRFEGPGWESDLITYRYYLDKRNRNDIFGKKVDSLELQKIGLHDLVSNSKESYTKMLNWGMDIFKVGESLGIGSFALWKKGKFYAVDNPETIKCYIADNGPIKSEVYTKYFGWKVLGESYDLFSNLSITAGSRLTDVNLKLKGKNSVFATGLAKHANCNLLKPAGNNSKWEYLGLYGKQSLSGDNLGIAVFYKKSDLLKQTQDKTSYIILLNPNNGKLNYYFAAAWQQEPYGIKNQKEFEDYLNKTLIKLSNPIQINY